jgi:hypothetical protein
VNVGSSLIIILFLSFMEVIQLFMAETAKYYNQYTYTLGNDDGYVLLIRNVKKCTYFWLLSYEWGIMSNDCLKSYNTPFYSYMMKCHKFFNILRFTNFCDNDSTKQD